MAADFWTSVPSTYPNGSAFPAAEPYGQVVRLAKFLIASPHPEAADLTKFCVKVLACFSQAEEPESHRASLAVEALYVRKALLAAGLEQQERALSDALLLLLDYHEQSGHEVVLDLDKDGNRV
ncbi:hypothetical protein OUY22_02430 [Nonomuraea sp. MCN248]|uniref:Uncharacterized protein n=1 Tax=Nonomuraea corallina TaxID=2989783 RepID=A0ABT4S4Y3_9ACTN|nr:hypothetical protein [Nonomuraea corallina]MDA0632259.1 hypothetical protein [Nonomuraea corallina]